MSGKDEKFDFFKAIDVLKDSVREDGKVPEKKDRLLACRLVAEKVTEENFRKTPDFEQYLSYSIACLLRACGDSDSDVRMGADEAMRRLLKELISSHHEKIIVALFKGMKAAANSRAQRYAFLNVALVCQYIRPQKSRTFVTYLMPQLMHVMSQGEQVVLEVVGEAVDQMTKALGFYFTPEDFHSLFEVLLPALSHELDPVRRSAAAAINALCVNVPAFPVDEVMTKMHDKTSELLDTCTEHPMPSPFEGAQLPPSDKVNIILGHIQAVLQASSLPSELARRLQIENAQAWRPYVDKFLDIILRSVLVFEKNVLAATLDLCQRILVTYGTDEQYWGSRRDAVRELVSRLLRLLFSPSVNVAIQSSILQTLALIAKSPNTLESFLAAVLSHQLASKSAIEGLFSFLAHRDFLARGSSALLLGCLVRGCVARNVDLGKLFTAAGLEDPSVLLMKCVRVYVDAPAMDISSAKADEEQEYDPNERDDDKSPFEKPEFFTGLPSPHTSSFPFMVLMILTKLFERESLSVTKKSICSALVAFLPCLLTARAPSDLDSSAENNFLDIATRLAACQSLRRVILVPDTFWNLMNEVLELLSTVDFAVVAYYERLQLPESQRGLFLRESVEYTTQRLAYDFALHALENDDHRVRTRAGEAMVAMIHTLVPKLGVSIEDLLLEISTRKPQSKTVFAYTELSNLTHLIPDLTMRIHACNDRNGRAGFYSLLSLLARRYALINEDKVDLIEGGPNAMSPFAKDLLHSAIETARSNPLSSDLAMATQLVQMVGFLCVKGGRAVIDLSRDIMSYLQSVLQMLSDAKLLKKESKETFSDPAIYSKLYSTLLNVRQTASSLSSSDAYSNLRESALKSLYFFLTFGDRTVASNATESLLEIVSVLQDDDSQLSLLCIKQLYLACAPPIPLISRYTMFKVSRPSPTRVPGLFDAYFPQDTSTNSSPNLPANAAFGASIQTAADLSSITGKSNKELMIMFEPVVTRAMADYRHSHNINLQMTVLTVLADLIRAGMDMSKLDKDLSFNKFIVKQATEIDLSLPKPHRVLPCIYDFLGVVQAQILEKVSDAQLVHSMANVISSSYWPPTAYIPTLQPLIERIYSATVSSSEPQAVSDARYAVKSSLMTVLLEHIHLACSSELLRKALDLTREKGLSGKAGSEKYLAEFHKISGQIVDRLLTCIESGRASCRWNFIHEDIECFVKLVRALGSDSIAVRKTDLISTIDQYLASLESMPLIDEENPHALHGVMFQAVLLVELGQCSEESMSTSELSLLWKFLDLSCRLLRKFYDIFNASPPLGFLSRGEEASPLPGVVPVFEIRQHLVLGLQRAVRSAFSKLSRPLLRVLTGASATPPLSPSSSFAAAPSSFTSLLPNAVAPPTPSSSSSSSRANNNNDEENDDDFAYSHGSSAAPTPGGKSALNYSMAVLPPSPSVAALSISFSSLDDMAKSSIHNIVSGVQELSQSLLSSSGGSSSGKGCLRVTLPVLGSHLSVIDGIYSCLDAYMNLQDRLRDACEAGLTSLMLYIANDFIQLAEKSETHSLNDRLNFASLMCFVCRMAESVAVESVQIVAENKEHGAASSPLFSLAFWDLILSFQSERPVVGFLGRYSAFESFLTPSLCSYLQAKLNDIATTSVGRRVSELTRVCSLLKTIDIQRPEIAQVLVKAYIVCGKTPSKSASGSRIERSLLASAIDAIFERQETDIISFDMSDDAEAMAVQFVALKTTYQSAVKDLNNPLPRKETITSAASKLSAGDFSPSVVSDIVASFLKERTSTATSVEKLQYAGFTLSAASSETIVSVTSSPSFCARLVANQRALESSPTLTAALVSWLQSTCGRMRDVDALNSDEKLTNESIVAELEDIATVATAVIQPSLFKDSDASASASLLIDSLLWLASALAQVFASRAPMMQSKPNALPLLIQLLERMLTATPLSILKTLSDSIGNLTNSLEKVFLEITGISLSKKHLKRQPIQEDMRQVQRPPVRKPNHWEHILCNAVDSWIAIRERGIYHRGIAPTSGIPFVATQHVDQLLSCMVLLARADPSPIYDEFIDGERVTYAVMDMDMEYFRKAQILFHSLPCPSEEMYNHVWHAFFPLLSQPMPMDDPDSALQGAEIRRQMIAALSALFLAGQVRGVHDEHLQLSAAAQDAANLSFFTAYDIGKSLSELVAEVDRAQSFGITAAPFSGSRTGLPLARHLPPPRGLINEMMAFLESLITASVGAHKSEIAAEEERDKKEKEKEAAAAQGNMIGGLEPSIASLQLSATPPDGQRVSASVTMEAVRSALFLSTFFTSDPEFDWLYRLAYSVCGDEMHSDDWLMRPYTLMALTKAVCNSRAPPSGSQDFLAAALNESLTSNEWTVRTTAYNAAVHVCKSRGTRVMLAVLPKLNERVMRSLSKSRIAHVLKQLLQLTLSVIEWFPKEANEMEFSKKSLDVAMALTHLPEVPPSVVRHAFLGMERLLTNLSFPHSLRTWVSSLTGLPRKTSKDPAAASSSGNGTTPRSSLDVPRRSMEAQSRPESVPDLAASGGAPTPSKSKMSEFTSGFKSMFGKKDSEKFGLAPSASVDSISSSKQASSSSSSSSSATPSKMSNFFNNLTKKDGDSSSSGLSSSTSAFSLGSSSSSSMASSKPPMAPFGQQAGGGGGAHALSSTGGPAMPSTILESLGSDYETSPYSDMFVDIIDEKSLYMFRLMCVAMYTGSPQAFTSQAQSQRGSAGALYEGDERSRSNVMDLMTRFKQSDMTTRYSEIILRVLPTLLDDFFSVDQSVPLVVNSKKAHPLLLGHLLQKQMRYMTAADSSLQKWLSVIIDSLPLKKSTHVSLWSMMALNVSFMQKSNLVPDVAAFLAELAGYLRSNLINASADSPPSAIPAITVQQDLFGAVTTPALALRDSGSSARSLAILRTAMGPVPSDAIFAESFVLVSLLFDRFLRTSAPNAALLQTWTNCLQKLRAKSPLVSALLELSEKGEFPQSPDISASSSSAAAVASPAHSLHAHSGSISSPTFPGVSSVAADLLEFD